METKVFSRPIALQDKKTHYCPGCHHGIIHRLVAEAIDELGVRERTIAIASVGCSALSYEYWNTDCIAALHGRAPATATGAKRANPESIVFTYQGDGDLAAIGAGEIVHAAARSENITTIFVNNAIYGMTGGQMAPTTLEGQKTVTSPTGRDHRTMGYPIRMSELLSTLEGATYIERVAVNTPARIIAAKKAIKKAFENQVEGKGFSMVEVLSTCPTNWGLSAVDAGKWVDSSMIPYYPLGVFKDVEGGAR